VWGRFLVEGTSPIVALLISAIIFPEGVDVTDGSSSKRGPEDAGKVATLFLLGSQGLKIQSESYESLVVVFLAGSKGFPSIPRISICSFDSGYLSSTLQWPE
jgi:hypothetical protein